jgi:antibiotic biosynthesis monooxygenase (ABM) superfamily enzyme
MAQFRLRQLHAARLGRQAEAVRSPSAPAAFQEPFMSENATHRPGSAVIVQQVRPGCEAAYREWSRKINTACSQYPGFVDLEVFEPAAGEEESFVIVVRFASEAESHAWHTSDTCRALLEEAQPLLEQAVMHSPSSVYGAWFSGAPGGPAREPSKPWKEALVVLFVLYPTVMLLSLYVMPPLVGSWSLATQMYAGNLLSVVLMTWLLMPLVTGKLAFWLNPVKGSGPAASYGGLAIVLGGQLLMVALFHYFS